MVTTTITIVIIIIYSYCLPCVPRAVPFFTVGTAQGVLLSAARPQAKAWRAMALRAPRATWAGGTCKDMDPHVLSYNSQTRSPLEKPPHERERREGNHHHPHRTHTNTNEQENHQPGRESERRGVRAFHLTQIGAAGVSG